ncbi:MAG: zf-HC2 domain-containing protein, partial [Sandaracinaceae bacterium]
MDCEACTEGMIDLLFDELEDADATRLRTHLSGCEECTDAYARLSLGQAFANQMEMVAPPVGLLDGVLAAAHERAAERAAERAPARSLGSVTVSPPREALPEDEGLWSVMLSWVGGLAMRPQMAMAMTLVLMVGIGLWYLPELRRSDPADSQAIVDPSPVGEVGPSAALAPAEPLDLETDPRTGRIRPRVDEEGPRPTRPRPVRAEPDPTTPEAVATTDDSDSPPSDEALEEPAPPPRIEVAQLDPHVIPPGMGEVNLGEGQALQMAEAPVAPAPPPTGAPQA